MCGIAGVYRATARPSDTDGVTRMCSAMAHRGPDGWGVDVVDARDGTSTTLGHRRLAIIEPTPAGRQPMWTADRRYAITFNGEIYNYRELRDELRRDGVEIRTGSDTEVILAAVAHWGERAIARLRGIFAFAIVDAHTGTVLLARDPLGIKPLYVCTTADGAIAFASEVRSLLDGGFAPRRLSPHGLAGYLRFGSVQDPFTLIDGVTAIPSGSIARVTAAGIAIETFWSPLDSLATRRSPSRTEATDEVRGALEAAVRSQLVSDVPLGAFLSGGVDSSAIVALMRRVSPAVPRTFSVTFPGSSLDEASFAESVARALGTDHRPQPVDRDAMRAMMLAALDAYDQPSADGLNTYVVSRAAREGGVTVALSGVGGDELFIGYGGFKKPVGYERAAGALDAVPGGRALANAAASLLPPRRRALAQQLARGDEAPYWTSRTLFTANDVGRMGVSSLWTERSDAPWVSALYASSAGPLTRVSVFELLGYLRHTLLRDTDQMSMAHSLEVRVPLLDQDLVELVLGMADDVKVDGDRPKPLLVDAVADSLPRECIDRPKRGFEFPLEQWLRNDVLHLMQEAVSGRPDGTHLAFGPVRDVIAQSARPGERLSRAWTLLALMTWCDRHGVAL